MWERERGGSEKEVKSMYFKFTGGGGSEVNGREKDWRRIVIGLERGSKVEGKGRM